MKRLSVLLFLFIFAGLTIAQEEEEVGWVARFGIAGGINPVYLFPNLDAVNVKAKNMGLEELSSGMIMWGGGGYAYIMIIDNVRLGGIGLSGTTSTSGNVLGYNRQLDYSFGLGGVTVEYTLPFIKTVAVSVGSIIGVGSQSIEAYENSGDYTWENAFPQPAYSSLLGTPGSYSKIKNTFFTFTPTLNVDIPISRFIALRVGGGYVMNFNDSWEMNNGRDIFDVPSSLTENNFFIQTGIYFGFFAF